jgi:Arc/MetJ-type ribon-helix-helix transcriptional regulator
MSTSTSDKPPSFVLSAENEEFVSRQLELGRYGSHADVMNAAVDLLRLQALRERLAESRRQLDAGEYTEYDDEGLDRLFEDLKERARQRIAKRGEAP